MPHGRHHWTMRVLKLSRRYVTTYKFTFPIDISHIIFGFKYHPRLNTIRGFMITQFGPRGTCHSSHFITIHLPLSIPCSPPLLIYTFHFKRTKRICISKRCLLLSCPDSTAMHASMLKSRIY